MNRAAEITTSVTQISNAPTKTQRQYATAAACNRAQVKAATQRLNAGVVFSYGKDGKKVSHDPYTMEGKEALDSYMGKFVLLAEDDAEYGKLMPLACVYETAQLASALIKCGVPAESFPTDDALPIDTEMYSRFDFTNDAEPIASVASAVAAEILANPPKPKAAKATSGAKPAQAGSTKKQRPARMPAKLTPEQAGWNVVKRLRCRHLPKHMKFDAVTTINATAWHLIHDMKPNELLPSVSGNSIALVDHRGNGLTLPGNVVMVQFNSRNELSFFSPFEKRHVPIPVGSVKLIGGEQYATTVQHATAGAAAMTIAGHRTNYVRLKTEVSAEEAFGHTVSTEFFRWVKSGDYSADAAQAMLMSATMLLLQTYHMGEKGLEIRNALAAEYLAASDDCQNPNGENWAMLYLPPMRTKKEQDGSITLLPTRTINCLSAMVQWSVAIGDIAAYCFAAKAKAATFGRKDIYFDEYVASYTIGLESLEDEASEGEEVVAEEVAVAVAA